MSAVIDGGSHEFDAAALRLLDQFAAMRVCVVGDAMLDIYLEGGAARLSPEAPVPVVDLRHDRACGGGAANTALNVMALGARVELIGCVGDDVAGARLHDLLMAEGVDVRGLLEVPGRTTLTKSRVVADGQLLLRMDGGTTDGPPLLVQQALLANIERALDTCDLVLFSDYGYGVLSDAVVMQLVRHAERRATVAIDSKDLRRFARLLPDAVKPNHRQAIQLAGPREATLADADRYAQVLALEQSLRAATGARLVAVTLDSDGAIVFGPDFEVVRTKAAEVATAHPAGAGDTYFATLALALAAGGASAPAARLAAAAASIVVRSPRTDACRPDQLRQGLVRTAKVVPDLDALTTLVRRARTTGQRVVLTNGCFDLLHAGHVAYLASARQLGDLLVVALNTDAGVRRLKGPERPVNTFDDRAAVLAALESVDLVVAFDEPTPELVVRAVEPDIFAKGGDYTRETLPEADAVEELGGRVELIRFEPDRSTTATIQRIRARAGDPGDTTVTA
ncbi:MAG: cytidyltransferase [Thermoleophilia bacterium]|nr:cytidyltransferase [Thermoleophilia bacterium]MCZ4495981.1 cytidyltransferase [Thermoleophilia bacterium]